MTRITNEVGSIISASLMTQMRWILAEIAVISCLMHDQNGCLEILRDIVLWVPNNFSGKNNPDIDLFNNEIILLYLIFSSGPTPS